MSETHKPRAAAASQSSTVAGVSFFCFAVVHTSRFVDGSSGSMCVRQMSSHRCLSSSNVAVAPDALVLFRVVGEDVLAAVGVGEEDARDLRHKMIAPEGFAASPLVLGHLELKPELDGRSERVRGLDDVQERFQGHLQPRPHGEAVSIWVAHDVN